DVVGIHNIALGVLVDPKAPGPQYTLDYTFTRLPVDLSVHLFHSIQPRTTGYRLNNQDVPYDESTDGITTGVSYNISGDFDSHNIGASFSVANFHGSLPTQGGLDPYAPLPTTPPRGNINILHLGYSFSNVETSL